MYIWGLALFPEPFKSWMLLNIDKGIFQKLDENRSKTYFGQNINI